MTNLEGHQKYGDNWKGLDELLILAGAYRSQGKAAASLWDAESGRVIFHATMPLQIFHTYSRLLRFDDCEAGPARHATDKLVVIREVWVEWVERLPYLYNAGPDVTVDEKLGSIFSSASLAVQSSAATSFMLACCHCRCLVKLEVVLAAVDSCFCPGPSLHFTVEFFFFSFYKFKVVAKYPALKWWCFHSVTFTLCYRLLCLSLVFCFCSKHIHTMVTSTCHVTWREWCQTIGSNESCVSMHRKGTFDLY